MMKQIPLNQNPWKHLTAPVILSLLLLLGAAESQAADIAGHVARVQGSAFLSDSTGKVPLSPGMTFFQGQTLFTGSDARIQAVFSDGTQVTLGEETRFTIDTYLYGPQGGRALFKMAGSAFRAITGLITEKRGDFTVVTPIATLGIRGTDFWGGQLVPGVFDVLMISGRAVVVTTPQGEKILNFPGQGVTIPGKGQPPGEVKFWPEAKVRRAVATVTFR